MYYFFDIVASMILFFCIINIWNRYGAFKSKYKFPLLKIHNLVTEKKYVWLFIVTFMILAGISILLTIRKMNILNWLKIILILFCLISCAFIDFKRHIIPNKIVFITLVCGGILLIFDFILRREYFLQIMVSSLLGCGFFAVLLLIVSIVTKKALGLGDVKLFSCMGFVLGFATTYSILLYSLILCAICSVYLLAVKKKGRKYAMPFGPFILFGFLFVVISGGY